MGLAIHNYNGNSKKDKRDSYSQYVIAHNMSKYHGKWDIQKNSDGTYSIMFVKLNNGSRTYMKGYYLVVHAVWSKDHRQ